MGLLDEAKERHVIRERIEMWRRADTELAAVRKRDAQAVTIQEAIHQIFDGMESAFAAPASLTSGLVEQQMWFSRIRAKSAGKLGGPPAGK
jgi:hypothetical protein